MKKCWANVAVSSSRDRPVRRCDPGLSPSPAAAKMGSATSVGKMGTCPGHQLSSAWNSAGKETLCPFWKHHEERNDMKWVVLPPEDIVEEAASLPDTSDTSARFRNSQVGKGQDWITERSGFIQETSNNFQVVCIWLSNRRHQQYPLSLPW